MTNTQDNKSSDEASRRQQRLPLVWDGAAEEAPDPETPAPEGATPASKTPEDAAVEPALVASRDDGPAAEEEPPEESRESGEVGEAFPTADEPGDEERENSAAATEPAEADIVHLESTVETAGERLMRARADAGLTVEETAARTRLRTSVIEAIETDRYDRLPEPYYCVRHIETLCREYNIDPEPIVEQFCREAGCDDASPDSTERFSVTSLESESGARVAYTPTAAMMGKRRRSLSVTGIIVSLLILLLAAMAVGAWAVRQWRARTAEQQKKQPAATAATDKDLTRFIVPQELPLESMPIPED